jgi:hypothetical protein
MVSKERKNRPKKKEIPQDKWEEQLANLRRTYAYGGEKQKVQSSSGNQTQK